MNSDETNAALDPRDGEAVALAVREILRRNGFTLYRVAALSRTRHPHRPASHIRRNFYFQLRSGLSPTFQQVLTLAELTHSNLPDWLRVFGLSLSDIPRLQSMLPRTRTGLIDKDLADPQGPIPFLRYRRPGKASPAVAPLSQLLEQSGFCEARALGASARSDFIYAKIGSDDNLAFPELLPGSIVRADPRLVPSSLPADPARISRNLFLVEHGRGLNCGRLRVTGHNRIAFAADNTPLAGVQFRLGTEARILGVVDLELRFPFADANHRTAVMQNSLDAAKSRNPTEITTLLGQHPRALLRRVRLRAALSFRAASRLSRWVAKRLGDDRYFTSPGALSDYEAADRLPRHIHKVFTLAIVYCVAFRDLLRAFGIALREHGGRTGNEKANGQSSGGFFENLGSAFGDVPLFLAEALPALSGIARITLRDVFWFGEEHDPLHPSLRGAVLVLVNRRNKKPRRFSKMPAMEQPVYLLESRDGSYLAANYAIEKGRMILYAYPQGLPEGQAVRRCIDAVVVGQIAGIARSLVSPP